jgi:transcriptional regulator with XRE-family HTH domain
MPSSLTLGAVLADIRRARGMTQAELSTSCYYEYNIASKWEHSQRKPSLSDWQVIQRVLALTPSELRKVQPLLEKGLASQESGEREHALRIDPNVCQRLRHLREMAGMSALTVANELGIAPSQMSRMESGTTNPSYAQLYKLVRLYSTTYDYILEGDSPANATLLKVTAERDQLKRLVQRILDPNNTEDMRQALAQNMAMSQPG